MIDANTNQPLSGISIELSEIHGLMGNMKKASYTTDSQ